MPVGKTKDAGWQVGVSRTLSHPVADVWEVLISAAGVEQWLGARLELGDQPGQPVHSPDGGVGEIRSNRAQDRVRLQWRPRGWDHDTIVQVAVRDKGDRTTITFHQENLASAKERTRQRRHWQTAADQIEALLNR